MFTLFFTGDRVHDYQTALKSDVKRFVVFFNEMLNRHVYLAPSQFEAAFLSSAHSDKDIDKTLLAAAESLKTAFSY